MAAAAAPPPPLARQPPLPSHPLPTPAVFLGFAILVALTFFSYLVLMWRRVAVAAPAEEPAPPPRLPPVATAAALAAEAGMPACPQQQLSQHSLTPVVVAQPDGIPGLAYRLFARMSRGSSKEADGCVGGGGLCGMHQAGKRCCVHAASPDACTATHPLLAGLIAAQLHPSRHRRQLKQQKRLLRRRSGAALFCRRPLYGHLKPQQQSMAASTAPARHH